MRNHSCLSGEEGKEGGRRKEGRKEGGGRRGGRREEEGCLVEKYMNNHVHKAPPCHKKDKRNRKKNTIINK